jgi:hypothetical protein
MISWTSLSPYSKGWGLRWQRPGMISWTQLLAYSHLKIVRGLDATVVTSVAVGNLNEWLKPIGIEIHLPWIYHFWFIGALVNLAGVVACRSLSPPEIRLHRSMEKYIDAKRAARKKSDQDDADHVQRETAAVSVTLFSALAIELDEVQKQTITTRLFDHINSETIQSDEGHSNVLTEEWKQIDLSWSWRKIVVAVLFLIGLILYAVFVGLILQKGWNAIGNR